MESIQIVGYGKYLPKNKIDNGILAEQFGVTESYIEKRTGIQTRYIAKEENIVDMAVKAVEDMLQNAVIEKQKKGLIIVATTTTTKMMPGISYEIQKYFDLNNCMCLDILGGCNGYINAFDIARSYIAIGKVEYALVIGVDHLSAYTDQTDIGTGIILSDGAGATLIRNSKEDKFYHSYIQSEGQKGEILVCDTTGKIQMDGKEIYKYAVTRTIENIEEALKQASLDLNSITYIVPHQSNLKIMKAIANRLKMDWDKMYSNIDQVGNTFCASIPIALCQMQEQGIIKQGDKLLLLGYGGGLNTGTVILEV